MAIAELTVERDANLFVRLVEDCQEYERVSGMDAEQKLEYWQGKLSSSVSPARMDVTSSYHHIRKDELSLPRFERRSKEFRKAHYLAGLRTSTDAIREPGGLLDQLLSIEGMTTEWAYFELNRAIIFPAAAANDPACYIPILDIDSLDFEEITVGGYRGRFTSSGRETEQGRNVSFIHPNLTEPIVDAAKAVFEMADRQVANGNSTRTPQQFTMAVANIVTIINLIHPATNASGRGGEELVNYLYRAAGEVEVPAISVNGWRINLAVYERMKLEAPERQELTQELVSLLGLAQDRVYKPRCLVAEIEAQLGLPESSGYLILQAAYELLIPELVRRLYCDPYSPVMKSLRANAKHLEKQKQNTYTVIGMDNPYLDAMAAMNLDRDDRRHAKEVFASTGKKALRWIESEVKTDSINPTADSLGHIVNFACRVTYDMASTIPSSVSPDESTFLNLQIHKELLWDAMKLREEYKLDLPDLDIAYAIISARELHRDTSSVEYGRELILEALKELSKRPASDYKFVHKKDWLVALTTSYIFEDVSRQVDVLEDISYMRAQGVEIDPALAKYLQIYSELINNQ